MPNLDELKAQYDKMKNETEKLGQEIEKLESEGWPKMHEPYNFISDTGQVESDIWNHHKVDHDINSFLGVYKTCEEAEAKLAVVKATMSPTKRWIPEDSQAYWVVNDLGNASRIYWNGGDFDHYRLATNNVHRTKEEAEAYARLLTEYGKSIVK